MLQGSNANTNNNKEGRMDEFNRRKVDAIEHSSFFCMSYEYKFRRGKHLLASMDGSILEAPSRSVIAVEPIGESC